MSRDVERMEKNLAGGPRMRYRRDYAHSRHSENDHFDRDPYDADLHGHDPYGNEMDRDSDNPSRAIPIDHIPSNSPMQELVSTNHFSPMHLKKIVFYPSSINVPKTSDVVPSHITFRNGTKNIREYRYKNYNLFFQSRTSREMLSDLKLLSLYSGYGFVVSPDFLHFTS